MEKSSILQDFCAICTTPVCICVYLYVHLTPHEIEQDNSTYQIAEE